MRQVNYVAPTKSVLIGGRIFDRIIKYFKTDNPIYRKSALVTDTLINYCKLKGFTNPSIKDIISISTNQDQYKGIDKIVIILLDNYDNIFNKRTFSLDPISISGSTNLYIFLDYSLLEETDDELSKKNCVTFVNQLSQGLDYLNDVNNYNFISHIISIYVAKELFGKEVLNSLKNDAPFMHRFNSLVFKENVYESTFCHELIYREVKWNIIINEIIDSNILIPAAIYSLFEMLDISNYIEFTERKGSEDAE